jgi:hypothetical protein
MAGSWLPARWADRTFTSQVSGEFAMVWRLEAGLSVNCSSASCESLYSPILSLRYAMQGLGGTGAAVAAADAPDDDLATGEVTNSVLLSGPDGKTFRLQVAR